MTVTCTLPCILTSRNDDQRFTTSKMNKSSTSQILMWKVQSIVLTAHLGLSSRMSPVVEVAASRFWEVGSAVPT